MGKYQRLLLFLRDPLGDDFKVGDHRLFSNPF